MKKMAKAAALLAAMVLAATLPCFAKGSVVTQWWARDGGDTGFLTFYSDKTWKSYIVIVDENSEGTYSGDTTKNGKISITGEGESLIAEIVEDAMEADGLTFTKVKK